MANYVDKHWKGMSILSLVALIAMAMLAPAISAESQKCQARLSDDPAEAEIPCGDSKHQQGENSAKTDTA